MKKTQQEGSEQQGGWPSKKVMADRSGVVFSLDFLFIEQMHQPERGKRVSYRSLNTTCRARLCKALDGFDYSVPLALVGVYVKRNNLECFDRDSCNTGACRSRDNIMANPEEK